MDTASRDDLAKRAARLGTVVLHSMYSTVVRPRYGFVSRYLTVGYLRSRGGRMGGCTHVPPEPSGCACVCLCACAGVASGGLVRSRLVTCAVRWPGPSKVNWARDPRFGKSDRRQPRRSGNQPPTASGPSSVSRFFTTMIAKLG